MKTILLGSWHGGEIVDIPDGQCIFEVGTADGKTRQIYMVCPSKSATAVPIGRPFKTARFSDNETGDKNE